MKIFATTVLHVIFTAYFGTVLLYSSSILADDRRETYELPYINKNLFDEDNFEKYIGMSEQEYRKAEEGYSDDQSKTYECGRFLKQRVDCVRMTRESPNLGTTHVIVSRRPYAAPLPAIGYKGFLAEAGSTPVNFPLSMQHFELPGDRKLPPAEYGWADLRDVIDGNSVVREWTKLADSGAKFSCGPHFVYYASGRREKEPSYCTRFVFARVASPNGPTHGLAACSFYGKSKVPSQCRLIFLDLSTRKVMVAAKTYEYAIFNYIGKVDFYFEIQGEKIGQDISKPIKLVKLALSNAPFSLDIGSEGTDIDGSADQRYSDLLEKWAKQYVHVHLEKDSNLIKLSVATSLWVSSQNSSDPSDWHEPSRSQNSDYISTLASSFKEKLSQLCPGGNWETDYKIYKLSCPQR
jgi:hypothetical protein